MIIIGEKINGMSILTAEAIKNKDFKYIQNLALEQIKNGVDALDVSVGPIRGDQAQIMEWLVKTIREVTDITLSIDSPHPEVIISGVLSAGKNTIINSIKKTDEYIEKLIPLAVEQNSGVICLLMDDKGIPVDINQRLEIAAELFAITTDAGISIDNLFFDPILMPISSAQKEVSEVFELINMLKHFSDPSPHIIVGLSNISQKTKYKSLINRTFCSMAMTSGLDSAILDPMDKELMDTIKTAKIMLNKELYAPSYAR